MARTSAITVVDMILVFGLPAWAVVRYWAPAERAIMSATGGGTLGRVVVFLALLLAIAAAIQLARFVWAAITGRTV
jgi:hypothetical protein